MGFSVCSSERVCERMYVRVRVSAYVCVCVYVRMEIYVYIDARLLYMFGVCVYIYTCIHIPTPRHQVEAMNKTLGITSKPHAQCRG